jgi:hypothetical protein
MNRQEMLNVPERYQAYVDHVGPVDLLEELEISLHDFIRFAQNVPLGKHDYRYAPGKWTLKDIIQHLIDCERIFAYRALRFGRGDVTPLPGFEENDYADAAHGSTRHLKDLLTELSTVRHATLTLFKSFRPEALRGEGVASNALISVGAIGFVIIGHMKHHQKVFEERYL